MGCPLAQFSFSLDEVNKRKKNKQKKSPHPSFLFSFFFGLEREFIFGKKQQGLCPSEYKKKYQRNLFLHKMGYRKKY